MWEDRKPNLKHLSIFGCEAYAKILKLVKKLDGRSKNYILIGHTHRQVIVSLWDKERQVKIARDVKFKEDIAKKLVKTEKRRIIN